MTPADKKAVHDSIFAELERQSIVERRVLRLRLIYYYRLYQRLSDTGLLWIKLYDEISRLRNTRQIQSLSDPNGKPWFHLPSLPPDHAAELLHRKHDVLRRWNETAREFGHPFEELIREAFRQQGYALFPRATRPELLLDGQRVQPEIDIQTISPYPLLGTAKNITSEVIPPHP